MLSIRLSRVGRKKQPTYRIVVQEKQRDPWGTSIEIVGSYNPRTEPKTIILKEDRIKHWISNGAQPTDTVHNLLVDAKLVNGPKRRATTHDKKEPAPAEEKAEETPAAAPAEAKEEAPAEAPAEEAPAEEKAE
jgi:small subunit ribosomal protein S16